MRHRHPGTAHRARVASRGQPRALHPLCRPPHNPHPRRAGVHRLLGWAPGGEPEHPPPLPAGQVHQHQEHPPLHQARRPVRALCRPWPRRQDPRALPGRGLCRLHAPPRPGGLQHRSPYGHRPHPRADRPPSPHCRARLHHTRHRRPRPQSRPHQRPRPAGGRHRPHHPLHTPRARRRQAGRRLLPPHPRGPPAPPPAPPGRLPARGGHQPTGGRPHRPRSLHPRHRRHHRPPGQAPPSPPPLLPRPPRRPPPPEIHMGISPQRCPQRRPATPGQPARAEPRDRRHAAALRILLQRAHHHRPPRSAQGRPPVGAHRQLRAHPPLLHRLPQRREAHPKARERDPPGSLH